MIVSKRGSQDGDPPKATTKGHFQDLKPPISGVTKSKLYQIVPSRSTCCRGPCTTEATDESEQSRLRDGKLMAVTSQAQRLSYPHNQWGGTFIYEYLWIKAAFWWTYVTHVKTSRHSNEDNEGIAATYCVTSAKQLPHSPSPWRPGFWSTTDQPAGQWGIGWTIWISTCMVFISCYIYVYCLWSTNICVQYIYIYQYMALHTLYINM